MTLYTYVAGRADGLRHLIRTAGTDATFPRSLCEAPIRLRDDPLGYPCGACLVKAFGELALALETVGLPDLAARVAGRQADASYETRSAQAGG